MVCGIDVFAGIASTCNEQVPCDMGKGARNRFRYRSESGFSKTVGTH